MSRYDFSIPQGTDKTITFVLSVATSSKDTRTKPDLTGCTAAMQLRQKFESSLAVDTLTTENGRLQMDANAGKITAVFTHQLTKTYPVQRLVYDMKLISADHTVSRVVWGTLDVLPEVTRHDD